MGGGGSLASPGPFGPLPETTSATPFFPGGCARRGGAPRGPPGRVVRGRTAWTRTQRPLPETCRFGLETSLPGPSGHRCARPRRRLPLALGLHLVEPLARDAAREREPIDGARRVREDLDASGRLERAR